jgi:hypothetical protein
VDDDCRTRIRVACSVRDTAYVPITDGIIDKQNVDVVRLFREAPRSSGRQPVDVLMYSAIRSEICIHPVGDLQSNSPRLRALDYLVTESAQQLEQDARLAGIDSVRLSSCPVDHFEDAVAWLLPPIAHDDRGDDGGVRAPEADTIKRGGEYQWLRERQLNGLVAMAVDGRPETDNSVVEAIEVERCACGVPKLGFACKSALLRAMDASFGTPQARLWNLTSRDARREPRTNLRTLRPAPRLCATASNAGLCLL